MLSEPDRHMEKLGGDHRMRRTAALASLKVGWCLLYQAAGWGRTTVLDFCVNGSVTPRAVCNASRGPESSDYAICMMPIAMRACWRK
jgi:hypothetical protein